MNNIIVFPILIPLLFGAVLFFVSNRILRRTIAALGMIAALIVSGFILHAVSREGIQTLHVGGWQAPFGITLVADMMSALLVLTSCIVGLACLLYAFHSIGEAREKNYVYSFMLILVSGVNGSFLTGDLFNLFVFFEVMLIASYVLLSLGGERKQLRETIKYMLINIMSSSLFVVSIGYLYSVTGTLNFAHLSERVAEVGQDGMLTTISLIFLIVFAIKAALFLYYWLPGSYSAPPAAISALFAALLTKVGVYSIIRLFTLIFYHQPDVTHTVLLWLSVFTMLLGSFGAIAHWNVNKILAYNVIIAVGFIIFGVAITGNEGLSGALYYLIHDMIIKALLFILGGALISIAGTNMLKEMSGIIRYHPMLGWLFLISGLALAGIPPLSGFIGKIMVLQSGVDTGLYWVVGVGLFSSLMVLYSVIKMFIHGFWGEAVDVGEEKQSTGAGVLVPAAALTAIVVFMGLGAEPILDYIEQAVEVLKNPALYIEAVLGQK